jgi:hypothetical protein
MKAPDILRRRTPFRRGASTGAALVAAAVVASSWFAPCAALAQNPSPADTAFEEGRALMKSGDLAAACAKFEESDRLEPAAGTLLNLADCYERVGRYASAWRAFTAGAEAADHLGQFDRARRARERAAAVRDRLATITLVVPSAIASAEIRLDGEAVPQGAWGAAWPVDPGPHTIEASAPDRRPWSAQIIITRDAERVSVTVPDLSPADGTVASVVLPSGGDRRESSSTSSSGSPAPVDPKPEAASKPGAAHRTGAYALGGASLVAIGIGTFASLQALSKRDDSGAHCSADDSCDPEGLRLRAQSRSAGNVATVSFEVAGALVAGAVVLWITAPDPSPARAAGWRRPALGVTLGERSGVVIRGAF